MAGSGINARQGVQSRTFGHPKPVHPEVHAAPVAAAEGVVRLERGALDLAVQRRRHARGHWKIASVLQGRSHTHFAS